ncbi:class I tRNA ligase family protein [Candidatus Omnitrophota bacterium]
MYEFFWHEFCDWYIELAKKTISAQTTQVVLYKVLEKSLRILHPLMPFITEEIWQNLNTKEKSIMISTWPHLQKQFIDKKAESQMKTIIACISAIRNIRAVWQIEPAKKIEAKLSVAKPALEKLLKEHFSYITDLAKVETLEIAKNLKRPKASAVAVIDDIEIFVPLAGIIDVQKEATRLKFKIKELDGILQKTDHKLKNKQFLSRAPAVIVNKEKEKKEQLKASIKKLKGNLKGFK